MMSFKLPFSRFNCSCSKKKSNKVGPQYVIILCMKYEAWIIEQ